MLIAISGSQGSGKTTLLNEIKNLGYYVSERKTARSILSDWNVTLDIVNENFDLKLAFQDELIKRKHADEIELSVIDNEIFFTERTFADLFTYALIAFGQWNKFDNWLNDYFETCKKYCRLYEHVFYLKPAIGEIEDDGIRSVNKHYSRLIDNTMLDITKQMVYNENITIIESSNLSERLEIVLETLNKRKLNNEK